MLVNIDLFQQAEMSRVPERSGTHSMKSSLSDFPAFCLYRSMDWEEACVCVDSAGVGLHLVLGLFACFWHWKLWTRTIWDQLHHQLVIRLVIRFTLLSDLLFTYTSVLQKCKWSACVTTSRWRMRSSVNDKIYIVLVLILCFGFPSLTIITSYLAILLTVRMWHKMKDLGTM